MNILDGGRVKETAVTYGLAREIYGAKVARMCRDVMKLKMSFVAVLELETYTYREPWNAFHLEWNGAMRIC